MPITITAGLSRKVGLPDYGSLGASCQVEFEADASLLEHDLEGFHARLRDAYIACSQAVHDELARQQGTNSPPAVPASNGANSATSSSQGQSPAPPSNGHQGEGRLITDKQLTYARQLAARIKGLGGQGLDAIAHRCFFKPAAALTSFEASQLIDQLKAIKAGDVPLPETLAGATS